MVGLLKYSGVSLISSDVSLSSPSSFVIFSLLLTDLLRLLFMPLVSESLESCLAIRMGFYELSRVEFSLDTYISFYS